MQAKKALVSSNVESDKEPLKKQRITARIESNTSKYYTVLHT
jgi:hypothetical protein